MRPDLKFLVQIFITVYREGQRPSVKRDLSCVGVWGFFLYTVFVFMSACFSKSMILSLIVQNEEMRGGLRILHNTIFFNLNIEENKNTYSYLREQVQF